MPALPSRLYTTDPKDFDYLFTLAAQIVETSSARRNVELDFTGCKFLMQNAVAILVGLAKLRTVEALWFSDGIRSTSKCVAALDRNQFLRFFGQPSREPIGGWPTFAAGEKR